MEYLRDLLKFYFVNLLTGVQSNLERDFRGSMKSTAQNLIEHCREVAKEVAKWPKWKQVAAQHYLNHQPQCSAIPCTCQCVHCQVHCRKTR